MSSRPATIRRAVVLPQPEGPTSTMNSPSRISRSRPSTAVVPSGYVFVTPSKLTAAIYQPPLVAGKILLWRKCPASSLDSPGGPPPRRARADEVDARRQRSGRRRQPPPPPPA